MGDPIYTRAEIDEIAESTDMEFSDDGTNWQTFVQNNSGDFYGAGIISYAQRWAKLMQHATEVDGMTLAECWEQLSFDCDWEGMSGASYGFAVQTLIQSWVYGSELEELYRAKYNW